MATERVRQIVREAHNEHILVPAFNAAHLTMIEPICKELAALDTFGLVEVSRPDIERWGAQSIEAVATEYRKWAHPRHTALHLDHVPVIDEEGHEVDWRTMIQNGLDCGYDSVMIDASRLELEDNIRVTADVVKMAAQVGVPVEAELGAVLGHEPGPIPDYEELFRSGRGFTAPAEATRFVQETGVDWLSVAVGNIHGAIAGAAADGPKVRARLNIERVKLLSDATHVPLVLHGGSGIPSEYILDAVQHGVVKLNIGTEIRQAYERELRTSGSEKSAQDAVAASIRQLADQYRLAGTAERLPALSE